QLYRWGKDVTNNPMWKARSKDSVIEFWQGKSGKIRMICRENLTEKLRLNQFVPIDIKLIEKGEISCQWGPSIDETIAQEEFNQGLSQWAIKFETLETCKKFQEMLRCESENNKVIKDNNYQLIYFSLNLHVRNILNDNNIEDNVILYIKLIALKKKKDIKNVIVHLKV
ncbi:hypothetical protein RFI_36609, partial [Reticulomyxa filosa]